MLPQPTCWASSVPWCFYGPPTAIPQGGVAPVVASAPWLSHYAAECTCPPGPTMDTALLASAVNPVGQVIGDLGGSSSCPAQPLTAAQSSLVSSTTSSTPNNSLDAGEPVHLQQQAMTLAVAPSRQGIKRTWDTISHQPVLTSNGVHLPSTPPSGTCFHQPKKHQRATSRLGMASSYHGVTW